VVIPSHFRKFFRLLCSLGRSWIIVRFLRIASIRGSRGIGGLVFTQDSREVTRAGFRVVETEVVVDFKVEVVAIVIETTGTSTIKQNQYLRKNRRNPFQIRRRGPLKLKPL
jgi:hypothetical protein